MNCPVRCTICKPLVLSLLTSDPFEFHMMLDQNQQIFAEIFRTSSPWKLETFNRTSGLQDSLALGLQRLQVLNAGDVHQNFCLQNLQALDQKLNLQRLGPFIRTSCLRVFRSFWANL